MEEYEIKEMNFPYEWLNSQGLVEIREEELTLADYDVVKTLYELGGTDVIDSYLDMIWGAWRTMEGLIRCYDVLFLSKNKEEDAKKLLENLMLHLELPLENATTQISWEDDPKNQAESRMDGFGYGLIDELKPILVVDKQ